MSRKKKGEGHFCDFCGEPDYKLQNKLIEGPGGANHGKTPGQFPVYLCFSCVKLANQIFAQKEKMSTRTFKKVPTPRELVAYLDKHVVGQDKPKKALAVAVANHYVRLENNTTISPNDPLSSVVINKSNVLMVGPSGTGKSELAKTLADILDVPFAIGDATTLTEAGYVGEDVENLLLKLLRITDFDIERAERGIVYIDEIDKIGKTSQNVSITRDVSGEGVQQSLLKLLEGTIASIPPTGGRKHPEQQYIQLDTTNILFICGGAFIGLDDIINRRLGKRGIGFGVQFEEYHTDKKKNRDWLLSQTTSDDLIHFGLIPELVGRLPVIAPLHGLNEDALVRVLTEPQNALLKQYQKLFRYHNATLEFTDGAVREIAKLALKHDTGARALRTVIEDLMLDIQYNVGKIAGETYVITEEIVRREQVAVSKEAA